jgi:hypothetical protein
MTISLMAFTTLKAQSYLFYLLTFFQALKLFTQVRKCTDFGLRLPGHSKCNLAYCNLPQVRLKIGSEQDRLCNLRDLFHQVMERCQTCHACINH